MFPPVYELWSLQAKSKDFFDDKHCRYVSIIYTEVAREYPRSGGELREPDHSAKVETLTFILRTWNTSVDLKGWD